MPLTFWGGMYTRPMKRTKHLPKLSNEPTLLGTAVSVAVHGQSGYLLQLIVQYFNRRTQDMTVLSELLLRTLGEIHIQGEPTEQQSETIDQAAEELRKSWRPFRAAMTWLCSPKHASPDAPNNLKLLASGKWEPGRYPQIDKKNERFVRYFEAHGLKHFHIRLSLQGDRLVPQPRIGHFVDLFCACILDRCLDRKTSEMPFKICPTCGTLFVSERKQFCSQECQWKHYWTPERRADDKWVKDLEKFSRTCKRQYGRTIEDLRNRLALPKLKMRLESIKKKAENEEWSGWPRIIRRIQAVEQLAQQRT